jgi:hypothetical protein
MERLELQRIRQLDRQRRFVIKVVMATAWLAIMTASVSSRP